MLKHYYDNLTFDHCVVCSSSIYGFWLPRWYLQTLILADIIAMFKHYYNSLNNMELQCLNITMIA